MTATSPCHCVCVLSPQDGGAKSNVNGVPNREMFDAMDDTGVGGAQDSAELRHVQHICAVFGSMLRWLHLPPNDAYVGRL